MADCTDVVFSWWALERERPEPVDNIPDFRPTWGPTRRIPHYPDGTLQWFEQRFHYRRDRYLPEAPKHINDWLQRKNANGRTNEQLLEIWEFVFRNGKWQWVQRHDVIRPVGLEAREPVPKDAGSQIRAAIPSIRRMFLDCVT